MSKHVKIHSSLDPMLGVAAISRYQREEPDKQKAGRSSVSIYTYKVSGEEVSVHISQTETMIIARRIYKDGGRHDNPS